MKGLSAHSRIKELARQFWQLEEAMRFYPIDIERAVALSDLPLIIEMLPKLSIDKVRFWIIENNYPAFFDAESKNLHGFLLARNGYGVIFVNGSDPLEERRFTIAHEVAHYLMDYLLPRQKFLAKFGPSILEVLDGHRLPTISERLNFILSELPSPLFTHSLDSVFLTAYERTSVWKVEWRTDALAMEIIAPAQEAAKRIKSAMRSGTPDRFHEMALEILISHFGLPKQVASPYARYLITRIAGGTTLAEEWGITF